MSNMLLYVIGAIALLLILLKLISFIRKTVRSIPSLKDVHASLITEGCRRVQFRGLATVLGQRPRYTIGNDRVHVAYWRTKHADDDVVETLAIHDVQRPLDARATFRGGILLTWTYGGTDQMPLNEDEMLHWVEVLLLVRSKGI